VFPIISGETLSLPRNAHNTPRSSGAVTSMRTWLNKPETS
jgi:hypothetical protein